MRTVGMFLVTHGRVTLGRGIVVIASTEAYGQTYGSWTDGLTDICGLYGHSFTFRRPQSLAYEDSDRDSK